MGIQIRGSDDNISASDGSLTINGASFSTLQVNGQNLPTAGPLSNRNLIINGAMQVAQRGTSSNVTGYLLDRFKLDASGGTRLTTQESLTSGTPYNEGFRNFLRLQNTGTATGATNYRGIEQWIEAQNIAQSGWNYASSDSYVTLSFWVRASVGQTYYVLLKTQDGTEQNYGIPFTLSADTWTKVTKTIPGNSGITINNDNGKGLGIYFYPFLGTDYTDSGYTTETWAAHSGSAQLPDMTNTWAGTTNATFDITGVQLEVGTVATPFEHRSYGDELARCERYFQVIKAIQAMSGGSSTIVTASINLRTVMRSTPTWAQTGAFTFERSFYGGTTQTSASVTVYSSNSNTPYGSYLRFNNIPPTLPDDVGYYLNDSTDYLTASAEL